MEDITKLFCLVDDFCRDIEKNFAGKLLPNGKKPTRTTEIEHSEIMTIILLYQQSPCKNFKTFYLHYLTLLYKSEFPKLPSYTRFVALKPRVLWHLAMLLHWLCGQSENTGISYIDTTPIAVCHAKRISKNKVFAGIAKLSKSTYGWFFGFKLHMVINENGEIHALTLTKDNVDDRIPVPNLTEKLTGLLFGDKGYIAKELFQKLFDRGLKLVTKVKKGMKNTLISLNEKILLRKRSIIETVFGYLKNRLEIEHTRHRSPVDFLVHIFSTLISYSIKSKKPSISYTSFLNPEFALEEAYKLTKKSNGAPGIDGVTFKSIEAEGLEKYLQQIRHELITKTYSQNRNRRKEIPKVGEKLRTLNIPCIRDRIVQSALKLIIEPIFESDFQDGSYGYRPKKKAHEAINRVEKAAIKGNTKCIDVDLKSYFDNVRHHILMEKIARRINDKEIMHLIKLILKVGGKRGIAQGSPISPLLSNIYLNEVDKMLEKAKEVTKEGKYRHIEYARWADDLVILIDGHQKWEWLEKSVHKRLQEELAKLEVEVSQEKTKVVNLKKGETFTS